MRSDVFAIAIAFHFENPVSDSHLDNMLNEKSAREIAIGLVQTSWVSVRDTIMVMPSLYRFQDLLNIGYATLREDARSFYHIADRMGNYSLPRTTVTPSIAVRAQRLRRHALRYLVGDRITSVQSTRIGGGNGTVKWLQDWFFRRTSGRLQISEPLPGRFFDAMYDGSTEFQFRMFRESLSAFTLNSSMVGTIALHGASVATEIRVSLFETADSDIPLNHWAFHIRPVHDVAPLCHRIQGELLKYRIDSLIQTKKLAPTTVATSGHSCVFPSGRLGISDRLIDLSAIA